MSKKCVNCIDISSSENNHTLMENLAENEVLVPEDVIYVGGLCPGDRQGMTDDINSPVTFLARLDGTDMIRFRVRGSLTDHGHVWQHDEPHNFERISAHI